MKLNDYTIEDFLKVPDRSGFASLIICQSLVILPLMKLHHSGYRLMDFVAIRGAETPICRVSGSSGMLGMNSKIKSTSVVWKMDGLVKSGLLRIWPSGQNGISIEIGVERNELQIYSISMTGGKQNEICRDRRRNNNHGNLHSTKRRNIRTD